MLHIDRYFLHLKYVVFPQNRGEDYFSPRPVNGLIGSLSQAQARGGGQNF